MPGKKAAERPGAREGAMCITPASAREGAQLGDGATIKLRLEGATVASFLQMPTLLGNTAFNYPLALLEKAFHGD